MAPSDAEEGNALVCRGPKLTGASSRYAQWDGSRLHTPRSVVDGVIREIEHGYSNAAADLSIHAIGVERLVSAVAPLIYRTVSPSEENHATDGIS